MFYVIFMIFFTPLEI